MKIFKTALQDGDVILDDMQSFAGAFDKEVATEWIEELVMAAHITKSTGQLNTAVAKSKETSTVDATRGQVRAEVLHLSFLILGQAKDTSNSVFSPAEHQGAILVVDEAKENHLSCSKLASDLPCVCLGPQSTRPDRRQFNKSGGAGVVRLVVCMEEERS